MSMDLHRAPTVGSVIKKIIEINPELTTSQLIAIVQSSIERQGGEKNEFAQTEKVNEELALRLARKSLIP
jgi:hypothetical protein